MNKARIAVLGTGAIVREYHLPALLANPRAELVALGNLHAASLEPLARQHGIKQTYTDYNQLAADADIDAVVNALPNYLHAPVSIAMLQAGKHVLCEKPMALNVAEAEAMLAASEAAERTLMIAHPWRSSEAYRWLRGVVQAGTLGRVFRLRAHAVLAGSGPAADSWFVQPKLAGGGALTDIGLHAVDTIAFVFGDALRPINVFARIGTYHQPIPVEDTALVIIEYDGGLTAVVEAGWHHLFAPSPHGAMELFGTQGYARTFPTELHRRARGAWNVERPAAASPAEHIQAAMYEAQIDRFLDCVLEGAAPLCTGRHGLLGMRVLEAAYRSADSGQSVAL